MDKKLNCILMVDDDRATNFLNLRLLKKKEVADTVQIVRNGEEAIDYLKKSSENLADYPRPDLILLDINMPLVNGWDFLEKYNELPKDLRESIIILMLTTSLREVDIQKSHKTPNVKGLIHKPLTYNHIDYILQKFFAET